MRTQHVSEPSVEEAGGRFSPGPLGVVAQLVFAGALATIATLANNPTPEPIPRGIALGLLYAAPAGVALLGILGRRKSLLAAAALADVAGAPLSWSGLTLLFLVPAILFVGETGRVPRQTGAGWRGRLGGLAIGLFVAGLTVAAGIALLSMTEPLCWIATPEDGRLSYVIVPSIDNVPLSGGQSGGCTSAALTIQGAAVAGVLAIGAIVIAAFAALGTAGFRAPSAARGTG